MVAEKGDILDREEAQPPVTNDLLHELVEEHGTEVVVHLDDGSTVELHGHDTHVYSDSVYTQAGDDDVWFYKDKVTRMVRHYD